MLTKIIVLGAIGLVVIGIYRVEQRWTSAPESPGVVYVNPGFNTPSPAPRTP
ncbi:MAG TPA: hypothetical protein VHT51_14245 [Micropepsaceae bacterium]|nr:hypothetical protein [Micropepsaceae bacterium]